MKWSSSRRPRSRALLACVLVAVGALEHSLVTGSAVATPALVEPAPMPAQYNQVPVPTPGVAGGFGDVSCPTTTSCFAVGGAVDGARNVAALARWDGVRWRDASPDLPSGLGVLSSISCPNAEFCMATGDPQFTNVPSVAVAWNGLVWTNVAPTVVARLLDVDCTASDDCTAVGSAPSASVTIAATMHWDGALWTSTSPAPVSQAHELRSVSCHARSSCIAVGYRLAGSRWSTLIEQTSGSSWALVTHPRSSGSWFLRGVSCWSATGCLAVGFGSAIGAAVYSPLALRFNGVVWIQLPGVPVPYTTGSGAEWHAVDCTATACGALTFGHPNLQTNGFVSTIAHLNLTTGIWTQPSVDAPERVEGWQLGGIECSMPGCTAVGSFTSGLLDVPPFSSAIKPLIVTQRADMERAVRVGWTPAEAARLADIAARWGQTPAQAQTTSVGVVGYLLGFDMTGPVPQFVPDASPIGTTHVSEWQPNEVRVLGVVRDKFALDNEAATRLSVSIVSYLLGLGGHAAG